MKKLLSLTALVLANISILSGHAKAGTEVYVIDKSHSSVKFSIRHFVAKTTGNFGEFEGTIHIDRKDLTKSSVEATIKVPSIDTENKKRDSHLQNGDYFNSSENPLITFKSTSWEKAEGKDTFAVTGDLTMNGITKPVTLDVELLGFGEGFKKTQLSGWEATTTIDRTQWGIKGGQPAVGKDVDITINIEAARQ